MRLKVKNAGWKPQTMTPSTTMTHNPIEKVGTPVVLRLDRARPRLHRAEMGQDGSLEGGCGSMVPPTGVTSMKNRSMF